MKEPMDGHMVSKNEIYFQEGRDVILVEMGRDDVTISCTQGKITLWFGRQVSESIIRHVLFGISNIDSSISYELEIVCDFNTISKYESMGYTLISYAKSRGGYRAIFNLPFSKRIALAHFANSIFNRLKERDVRKILHWNGNFDMVILVHGELKKLDDWVIKRIEYKAVE
ncbi:hypothetical protein [Candidatus Methanoperedens nitratireducens]|uniref:Uncharacterized protein n=1 Tax=Candidatus Methanoperedens nitratireducens TaxID=1392998 RepID=A0A284VR51_9EURY|nr:hypothetical protein [Candidatus Methanoperedens nitroreducens]SNQ61755.1 conserved hypothetical protein [Candidatus Methanoperedens nitroreducens]